MAPVRVGLESIHLSAYRYLSLAFVFREETMPIQKMKQLFLGLLVCVLSCNKSTFRPPAFFVHLQLFIFQVK